MSSMWAPDNAQELQAARQNPRKTPFAAQHAKARDQGFWAPESAASGSAPSPGRRAKSGPGRSRGQGQDGMTPDRGGRASGRGRSRGAPHFQHPPEPMLSPVQQTTSARGYGRKTTKDREAIWQSIWGDDSDEDKEKEKDNDKDAKGKEKAVEGNTYGPTDSGKGNGDSETQLAKDLESVKITPAPPPPAPPAVVVPPPPVISGADWSELTDDEDLAFLEEVPVPLASAPESPRGNDSPKKVDADEARVDSARVNSTNGSRVPVSHGLDVTTANDIADSVHEGSPKVNVRHTQQDTSKDTPKPVDVKLANTLPVPAVNPEQAQTSADITSEGESSYTTVGRGGRPELNAGLHGSRWAGPAPRGMGNQRGARGGARPPHDPRMPFRNQPPQNFPRPPGQFKRPPPTGPRPNQVPGPFNQQPRGSGSRNAPPLTSSAETQRPQTSCSTPSESDRSSPFPHSTTSETSAEESFSADMQQRGPRQAAVPRDAVKRLMKGFMGPGTGGPRRGTSGRGRGRAPVGGAGQAPTQEGTS